MLDVCPWLLTAQLRAADRPRRRWIHAGVFLCRWPPHGNWNSPTRCQLYLRRLSPSSFWAAALPPAVLVAPAPLPWPGAFSCPPSVAAGAAHHIRIWIAGSGLLTHALLTDRPQGFCSGLAGGRWYVAHGAQHQRPLTADKRKPRAKGGAPGLRGPLGEEQRPRSYWEIASSDTTGISLASSSLPYGGHRQRKTPAWIQRRRGLSAARSCAVSSHGQTSSTTGGSTSARGGKRP